MYVHAHDLYLLSSDHRSEPIEVLGLYKAIFRPLTPGEWIEVWDNAATHLHPNAQRLKTMVGVLARGISKIDGQALTLDAKDLSAARDKLKLGPKDDLGPVQQAELILLDRFTQHVIEAFDQEYGSWYVGYTEALIEAAKKKRARAETGGRPSPSVSDSESSPPTLPSES